MKAIEIIKVIESIAPLNAAASWDNAGIQIASSREHISSIALCLDPTPVHVATALQQGAQFILSHHPLLMQAQYLNCVDSYHTVAKHVLCNDAWLYAAHTSLDANPDGPVAWLADTFALTNRTVIEPTLRHNYAAVVLPNASSPLERIDTELGIVEQEETSQGLMITYDAPYGCSLLPYLHNLGYAPLLHVAPRRHDSVMGFGLVGDLPAPLSWDAFLAMLQRTVPLDTANLCGSHPKEVRRLGYCTGSGSSLAARAFGMGADIFITGDVKYHTALEVCGPILDVGHFCLEEEMMRQLATILQKRLPDIHVFFLSGTDPLRRLLPATESISLMLP